MGILGSPPYEASTGANGLNLVLAGAAVVVIGIFMFRFRHHVIQAVIRRRSRQLTETAFAKRIDAWLPAFAVLLSCLAIGYGIVVIVIGVVRVLDGAVVG